jgi:hypothetical protein
MVTTDTEIILMNEDEISVWKIPDAFQSRKNGESGFIRNVTPSICLPYPLHNFTTVGYRHPWYSRLSKHSQHPIHFDVFGTHPDGPTPPETSNAPNYCARYVFRSVDNKASDELPSVIPVLVDRFVFTPPLSLPGKNWTSAQWGDHLLIIWSAADSLIAHLSVKPGSSDPPSPDIAELLACRPDNAYDMVMFCPISGRACVLHNGDVQVMDFVMPSTARSYSL